MEKISGTPKPDDFTSSNFIQRNQHNRDISSVRRRLDELEKRVGSNESFATTFAESAASQVPAQNALVNMFNNAINTNADTQKALRDFRKQDHFNNFLDSLKKVGGNLFWLVVGAVIATVVPMIFK